MKPGYKSPGEEWAWEKRRLRLFLWGTSELVIQILYVHNGTALFKANQTSDKLGYIFSHS